MLGVIRGFVGLLDKEKKRGKQKRKSGERKRKEEEGKKEDHWKKTRRSELWSRLAGGMVWEVLSIDESKSLIWENVVEKGFEKDKFLRKMFGGKRVEMIVL